VKRSKTGDVEVFHGVGDFAPSKTVPECRGWVRNKLLREGPVHLTVISDDFERDMGKENLARLAFVLDRMQKEGEALIGEDNTWVLIEE